MTIILTFKVAEGTVLATDSRLTILEDQRVVYTSDSHTKLFALGKRMGVMTCGSGFLGGRAAGTWVREFQAEHHVWGTVKTTAQAFLDFLPPADGGSATFVLTGFDDHAQDGFAAHIYKLNIFPDGDKFFFDLCDSVSFWDGEFEGLTRLLLGRSAVYTQLIARDLQGEQRVQEADQIGRAAMRIPYYAMSLQAGVNFARFLINLQIQYQQYTSEPQSCGGPVDIAVITPDAGFQWIDCKTLS
ncbi:Ntn hydrolase family protein [Anthocerotibacter panamensis]|uniref:hypothetical protein n=1 Tax=Anthocerotibacter panamensis TaxID=2857077 RepID=UPI001C4023E4|nr:hypothetical protein [Anthocerotibacter panamensis]